MWCLILDDFNFTNGILQVGKESGELAVSNVQQQQKKNISHYCTCFITKKQLKEVKVTSRKKKKTFVNSFKTAIKLLKLTF